MSGERPSPAGVQDPAAGSSPRNHLGRSEQRRTRARGFFEALAARGADRQSGGEQKPRARGFPPRAPPAVVCTTRGGRGLKRITAQGPSHGADRKSERTLGRRARQNPSARRQHKPNGAEKAPKRRSLPVMSQHDGIGSLSAWNAKSDGEDLRALMPTGREAGAGRTKATGQSRSRMTATGISPARTSTCLAFAPWPLCEGIRSQLG